MQYFFDTVETIPEGLGFSLFDTHHLLWLAAMVIICVGCSLLYRRAGEKMRRVMRFTVMAFLVITEIIKDVMLICVGHFKPDYLPLHLCGINIILIAVHYYKPYRPLGNFLYTTCIPGALAAMLFPTWTTLPIANFIHNHSFLVHIFLILYSLMLTVSGEIRPDVKKLPQTLLLLVGLAAIALTANLIWDTNFMFLMHADPGNPLYYFYPLGSHLIGFPVLITAVVTVMYLPWVIYDRCKNKKKSV